MLVYVNDLLSHFSRIDFSNHKHTFQVDGIATASDCCIFWLLTQTENIWDFQVTMGGPHNRLPMSGYVTKMAIHYSMFEIVDCSLLFLCLVVKSFSVMSAPSSRVAARFLKMILKGQGLKTVASKAELIKLVHQSWCYFTQSASVQLQLLHFLPIKLPQSLLSPCLLVKSFLFCLPCNLGLRLDCSR